MATTKELQEQIIQAMEEGRPTDFLEKQLREKRDEEKRLAEREQLQRIAAGRKANKARAAAVQEKIERQSGAVTEYLKHRDLMVKELESFKGKLAKLAPSPETIATALLMRQTTDLLESARDIPVEYLPGDTPCSFLMVNQILSTPEDVLPAVYFHLDEAIKALNDAVRYEGKARL